MNNLKKIRKEQGISQGRLAMMLGVTQGAVSQWETGRAAPNMFVLKKLAVILQCTVDELLADPKEAEA